MSSGPDHTVCFGPDHLYTAVSARMASDGCEVQQYFGWREPAKHRIGSRIVWVPGDEGGRMGTIGAPRSPGQNPRPLATLDELVTVYVSADDASAPESEVAQYRATRKLFDRWYAAVRQEIYGVFRVEDLSWDTSKNQRRHGTMLVCVLSIESAIFDAASAEATAAVSARIDLEILDEKGVVSTLTPT